MKDVDITRYELEFKVVNYSIYEIVEILFLLLLLASSENTLFNYDFCIFPDFMHIDKIMYLHGTSPRACNLFIHVNMFLTEIQVILKAKSYRVSLENKSPMIMEISFRSLRN